MMKCSRSHAIANHDNGFSSTRSVEQIDGSLYTITLSNARRVWYVDLRSPFRQELNGAAAML